MYSFAIQPVGFFSRVDIGTILDGIHLDNLKTAPSPELADKPSAHCITIRGDADSLCGGGIFQFTVGLVSIETIWIEPNSRGIGLGAKLVLAIEEYSISHGMRRAVVSTFEFQKAVGFWEKMGFSKFAELQDYPDGGRLLYMQKKFTGIASRPVHQGGCQ